MTAFTTRGHAVAMPTVIETSGLDKTLRALKLSGMLDTIDARLAQARAGELGHIEFLQVLCEDEISRRQAMSIHRRLRSARFEEQTTLEGFDFAASPKLPAAQIRDLAALRWLQAGESVILYGPVGVGKSHIAQALGHLAIRHGAAVRFLKTSRALAHLAGGRADGTWHKRLGELARPAVLILDDFAMRELTPAQADDLYELITERAGSSLILTSNRAPQDWYPLFPNPVVAESLLDRLINNSHQLCCTGWRYVTEELAAAGIIPHLAEPADTAAMRGKKRHAKTDKTDSRHMRSHLAAGDLPECWIPPAHVLQARAVVRLYKDLLDERGGWHQRIAATLFHQGVPVTASMATAQGRAAVAEMQLSPAGRQAVGTGLRQIDRLTGELDPLRRQLDMISRRQPGCRALRATQFGVGAVTSVAIWAELGDVRRFGNSDDVIRDTGLDITAYSSDGNRSAGHLSRQGPQLLRWALYESAKCAALPAAPDYGYYTAARDRRTAGPATLSVARKLAGRCYHTLRELGEEALAPAA